MENITAPTIIPGVKTEEFEIPEINFDFQHANHIHLQAKVVGFWTSPISIRITRNFAPDASLRDMWKADLNHGGGGVDAKNFDPLQSAIRFAHALIASADYIKQVMSIANLEVFEREYQRQLAEATAQREKAAKERDAALNADAPLGTAAATKAADDLQTTLKNAPWGSKLNVNAFYRGMTGGISAYAVKRNGVRFYFGSAAKSRKDFIAALALMSHRSAVETHATH